MAIATSDGEVHESELHMIAASIPPEPDYDYAGFRASGMAQSDNGHYPDTYKLPNHMTFSDQSKYHGVDGNEGGSWSQLEGDRWSFTPGATNFKNHSLQEMQQYFKKYEPGNVLNAEAVDKNKEFHIIDPRDGNKLMGSASSRSRASRSMDRLDNAYGGYRYRVIKNPDWIPTIDPADPEIK